jgi:hypothetical protein
MKQNSGDHNHWHSLGFFSRKLSDTESCYSTLERELIAAYAFIQQFVIFGKDHKPLVTTLSRVTAPISPRQQQHLALISKFKVQMLYLPGLKTVVTNLLFRPPPPPADW